MSLKRAVLLFLGLAAAAPAAAQIEGAAVDMTGMGMETGMQGKYLGTELGFSRSDKHIESAEIMGQAADSLQAAIGPRRAVEPGSLDDLLSCPSPLDQLVGEDAFARLK